MVLRLGFDPVELLLTELVFAMALGLRPLTLGALVKVAACAHDPSILGPCLLMHMEAKAL